MCKRSWKNIKLFRKHSEIYEKVFPKNLKVPINKLQQPQTSNKERYHYFENK